MIAVALIFLTFIAACIVFSLFDDIMRVDKGGLLIAIKGLYKLAVDIYNIEAK